MALVLNIFLPISFFFLVGSVYAFDVDLDNIDWPVEHPGKTSLKITSSAPISLSDNSEIKPYYSVKSNGSIEEVFELNDLVNFTQVKDIYVSRHPMNFSLTLISGAICVYGKEIERICISNIGERIDFNTEGESIVIVDGILNSVYSLNIVIGSGEEVFNLNEIERESRFEYLKIYYTNNTLYKISFADGIYINKYTREIINTFKELEMRKEAYETGSCPCETFDFNNPDHREPNNPNVCRIPGFAEGYIPKTIEEVPAEEFLGGCPEELTEEESRTYGDFKSRGLVAYTKVLPRLLELGVRWVAYEPFARRKRANIRRELFNSSEAGRGGIEVRLVEQLKRGESISHQASLLLFQD